MKSSASHPLTFRPARALKPGAKIAVIAPSGPFDADAFEIGVRRLRERYEVIHRQDVFERRGYLAGSDQRRAAETLEYLADSSVDALVCARGGYGAVRIGAAVDPEQIRKSGKLLVGFSDVTVLHARWAQAGVRSIHGTMVCSLSTVSDVSFQKWVSVAEGAVPETVTGLNVVAAGKGPAVHGPLLGGNLAVLCGLLGTPLFPRLDGAVLFIEDIDEAPYRIDRMLTQLQLAGVLDQVRAIVAGSFERSHKGVHQVAVEHVIEERLSGLSVPVLSGVPAGHGAENTELPFGATVAVDAGKAELRFLEPATA